MIIYPAIDIRGGRCVRLTEGRFDAETVFADDPAEMAAKWVDCGAEWLHLVDLDGALAGEGKNLPVIERILQTVKIPVELGGGIRLFPGDVFHDLRGGETRRVVLVRLGHTDVKIRDADAVQ